MATKSGHGCMFFLLILSMCMNVFLIGCRGEFPDVRQDSPIVNENGKKGVDIDINELRDVAIMLGVPEENAGSLSAQGLMSEIRIRLDNGNKFHGKVLSDEDMKVLNSSLADEPAVLSTLRGYNNFVKSVNGKKIIILP